jgi:DNA-directed RNA polymerase specialized sigma24 family protein
MAAPEDSEEAAAPEEQPEESEPERRGPCATYSEKLVRFQALTKEDYAKLLKWAGFMLNLRGPVGEGDERDLANHALLEALKDSRAWYPGEVDFLVFVGRSIRNYAFGWRRRARVSESPDRLPSPIDAEKQRHAELILDKIRDCLRGHPGIVDHPHALAIIDLKGQGFTGREIQEHLGITEQEHNTTLRWIRRTLESEGFRP